MAFRRSVASRAKILYRQQRIAVPFSHVDRDDNDREALSHHNLIYKSGEILLRRSPFGARDNMGSLYGSMNLFRDRRFAVPAAFPPVFGRNMSTLGEGADKLEIMTDVLGEKASEVASQVAPVANEVAVAAADSFFPVAAFQYMIDYVHTFTGFDWWLSIVLTTVLIRTLELPLLVHQTKALSKLTLILPQMKEITEDIRSRGGMNHAAVDECNQQMSELFKEYGISKFCPFKRILIGAPVHCCFFLSIIIMANKVQSFKDGGALWFTDLTTPDALFILPVLTASAFWKMAERKRVPIVCAALTIPLAAAPYFPKAIFCYWITAALYSLMYRWVIEKPEVKQMLGIPELPPRPSSPDAKPPLSFYQAPKKYAGGGESSSPTPPPPPPGESSSKTGRTSSSSVLNQRSESLEKEVKGRKKG